MNRHTRKIIHIAPTLAFMLSGADAIAAVSSVGTITYGPIPQSIPALSGSMLVVLGLLFAVLAFRALRAHSASKPLASIVAVGILILGAASGNQLIQNAWATPSGFTNPSGGVINVSTPNVAFPLENFTDQPQRVISVTPLHGVGSTQSPQCIAGLIVQSGSICYIKFTAPPPPG